MNSLNTRSMILRKKKYKLNKAKMIKNHKIRKNRGLEHQMMSGERKQLILLLISSVIKSQNVIELKRVRVGTNKWLFHLLTLRLLWSRENKKNRVCKKRHSSHRFQGKKFQKRLKHSASIIVLENYNQLCSVLIQTTLGKDSLFRSYRRIT